MGGGGSSMTSEKIQEDGSSTPSFDLDYSTYDACAINLGTTVVITGGFDSRTEVTEYSEAGPTGRDLPHLQQGRYWHGCSYFDNDEGTKTLLVTGGWTGSDHLSSTELLEETATSWVLAGELPTPRCCLKVANINNLILTTGGYDGDYYDDILEFSPSTGEWSLV